MKLYVGYRHMHGGIDGAPTTHHCAVRVCVDGRWRALSPRHDIHNHSPSGFEWGYGGSGPAQLALALVADACGPAAATPAIYQRVKRHIADLPADGWELTDHMVRQWVREASFEADQQSKGDHHA